MKRLVDIRLKTDRLIVALSRWPTSGLHLSGNVFYDRLVS